jgi:hypothetical protein
MAGIVQGTACAGTAPVRQAESEPQLGSRPRVLAIPMPFSRRNPRSGRAWALAVVACLFATLVAILAPNSADSAPLRVLVLGQTPETPKPSCPGKYINEEPIVPCLVEGHVTGFQSTADGIAKPFEAPFDGKVVAWSISLSRPSAKKTAMRIDEVGAFNEFLGKPAEARIGILRPIPKTKPPEFKLVRQGPIEVLNPYFGTSPIFTLEHPLVVLRGQIVALSVPTWAPMFAVELSSENTWRGSRRKDRCTTKKDIENGHAQQAIGSTKKYGCYYSKARLLYTATLVKKP